MIWFIVGQPLLAHLLSPAHRRVLSSSAISRPYPLLEEEESSHMREVETELAMRSGFGVTLMVELPNNKVSTG